MTSFLGLPKSSCEGTGGDFAVGGHYTLRRVLTAATALPASKASEHSVSRAEEAFDLALGPGESPFHGLALHVAHGHLGHNALRKDLRCDFLEVCTINTPGFNLR